MQSHTHPPNTLSLSLFRCLLHHHTPVLALAQSVTGVQALQLLLVFVGYPTIVALALALYKLRDDNWRPSK